MVGGVAGPITFKKEEYNGSLPNLILRPHSWTKVEFSVHIVAYEYIVQYFILVFLCLIIHET